MKQCSNCLSEDVSTVIIKDRLFYYCKNCNKKSTQIKNNDGQVFSEKENGLVKHITIGSLISKGNKILLINRKRFPYGLSLPTGHLCYHEKIKEALERTVFNKTGLHIRSSRNILHDTLFDQCKYGGELHEWYLFECKVAGKPLQTEEDNIWVSKNELKNTELIQSTKLILSKIGLLLEEPEIQNEILVTKNDEINSRSVIDNLPIPIFISDSKGKIKTSNLTAEKFKNSKLKLISLIENLALSSIKNKGSKSKNLTINGNTFNIVANPLIDKKRITGATIIIKNITLEKQKNATELLAYRTSLALCSNSSFSQIVKTLLKQMFYSLEITGSSLMLKEENKLKVAFRYSKTSHKKRKPREFMIGEGIAGWAASKKTIMAIPDTSKDDLFIGNAEKGENSLLSIPIISNNEVLGVLNVTKPKNIYFSEEEIKSSETVANRIALAIENERLYQEINRLYKESEQARHQMEKIINNTGDGITVRNEKGEFVVWNNAMKQITGFEKAEYYMANNPEAKNRQVQNRKEAIEKNKNLIHKDIKVKNSEKEDLWLGTTYTFIKDEKGNIINMIAVNRDISKEKEIENRQKEFIYTATHELRTPITAIKGYLSMLENGDGGKLKDQQKNYIERALKSTDRLVKLVEELLQTAKLEEENVLYDKKFFSGKKLVNEIIADLRNKAKAKNLNLTLNKPSENIKFWADYDKTRQAISNVLDNSIKYTQKGDIKIGINTNKNNLGYITIMDTGVGIPRKEQQNIFNKFIRIPNPESVKAGGTGLGLYIVKKIIEQQGGKIEVESELNKGTTFNIYLPLK